MRAPSPFHPPVVQQQDFDLLHARPDELVDCDFAVSVLVHLLERRLGEEILKRERERCQCRSFMSARERGEKREMSMHKGASINDIRKFSDSLTPSPLVRIWI